MKTKQIKGGKVDILLVGFDYTDDNDIVLIGTDGTKPYEVFVNGEYHKLPEGDWRFFSLISHLTDDLGKELVSFVALPWNGYPDYNSRKNWFSSSVPSVNSLFESNGVLPANKYQEAPPTEDLEFYDSEEDYRKCLALWKEADENVFKPQSTLIFVKR